MKGIDCSTTITPKVARDLKKNGIEFVIRYILPSSFESWKTISKNELEVLRTEGFHVGFVFERSDDRVKGGARAGVEDGKLVVQALKELGIQSGVVIYFAVDYDAPASHFGTIESYLRNASAQLGNYYKAGVYGSFSVVEAMLNRGVVDHAWQTLAWSRGKKSSRINIYQESIDKPFCGINVDFNTSYGNEGFLPPYQAQANHGNPQPKQKVQSQSKPKTEPNKVELINGIRVLGRIQVSNLKNFTYIYEGVDDSSKRLGKAYKGDIYPIAGSVQGWYEIIYNGKRAYIKEKYAKRI